MNGYGSEIDAIALFPGKPLATNMVLCCTEKLWGRTNTALHGAYPLYRLSTAGKWKSYSSEKRKVIGQTTHEVNAAIEVIVDSLQFTQNGLTVSLTYINHLKEPIQFTLTYPRPHPTLMLPTAN